MPLLTHRLKLGGVVRYLDEVGPHEQAGGQHRDDTDRGDNRQPQFELLALGFVGPPFALAERGSGLWQLPRTG